MTEKACKFRLAESSLVQMFTSYYFRLYPSPQQAELLRKHFGACRFVYNRFLAERKAIYDATGCTPNYNSDAARLTKLKQELEWLYEIDSQALQAELRQLDTAYSRFFKKLAELPKFHNKKTDRHSFPVPQGVKIKNDRLHIPKFKEGIRVRLHRPVEGKIKHATVSMNRAGQYFVSICVERETAPLPKIEKEIGVDLGLKDLVTCSDGQVFENIRPYRTLEKRLKRLHRSLSKKVKGSKSRERARLKLAKLYQRISNIRSDRLHKVSHEITRDNQAIYLEDLNVAGMAKNRKLAKSISDASLSELVRQIEYKAIRRGRAVTKIDRFYPSSKTCSSCGFVNKELTLSDRSWICPDCQTEHDRDLNAALNILSEGKRTVGTTGLAGGEISKTSAKKRVSKKPEVTS